MDPRHQTRWVTTTAMKRCLKELQQAVEDFPFPRREADHEMKKACLDAVGRLEEALNSELEKLSED